MRICLGIATSLVVLVNRGKEMIVVIEGLDGVGKTTLINEISNELFEGNNISSYIISPTQVNKTLKSLIEINFNNNYEKFILIIQEHINILNSCLKYKDKFNVIFLDRSIYSAYSYIFYKEKNITIKDKAIKKIISLEKQYKLTSCLLTIPEAERLKHLYNRETKKLFDKLNEDDSLLINHEFISLVIKTGLNNFISINHLKSYVKNTIVNSLFEERKTSERNT